MVKPVLSVFPLRDNGALIAYAARLWIDHENDFVVDVTYGRGKWWTHYVPRLFDKHDLALDGVDFRQLPYGDGTVDVVAFDPPYVSPGGRKTSTLADMNDRYGMQTTPKNPAENAAVIADGLKEIARVLRPGGRVLAKCMDYIWSGHFQPGHRWTVEAAERAGLVQVDEFVHTTGTGPQPTTNRDGTPRRQVHSRRAHSFLVIAEKPKARRG